MQDLLSKLELWITKQGYTTSMGEWYKGKSKTALSTDKMVALAPPDIRDNYGIRQIREQLEVIADRLMDVSDTSDSEAIDLEEIALIGVSESIFAVGDKLVNLELRGYSNTPNDIDAKLMDKVSFAHDSDNSTVYFLMTKHESGCTQYTRISGEGTDIDVESAMLKSRQYAKIQGWFEDMLLEWERDIVRIWNRNVKFPSNKVQDYILANIPVTLIANKCITIICSERETGAMQPNGDAEVLKIAHGVKWETKGTNPKLQYSDLVTMNVSCYKTSSIIELNAMPKIYGNAGQDAMSIFDIKPYFSNDDVELSKYWQEVKSKYTEDEWSVLSAWTIGMLDAKNTGRQSLAQIDYDGYSGKSVFSDVLIKFIGLDNATAFGKGSFGNQFWASKCWNKRLCVVDDNKNSKLLMTEAVHCLLGGGYADVEYKGESSFAWKMSSKLLINSNNDLEVNGSMLHERSRVIILKPKMPRSLVAKLSAKDENGNIILDQNGNPKLIGDNKFTDNLVDTIDGFLTQAVKYYKLLCPNRADIVLPNSILEHVYSSESSEETMFSSILKRSFTITHNDNDTMTQSELMERYMEVTKDTKIYAQYATPQEYGNFKLWIKKVHKIESAGKKRLFTGIKAIGSSSNNATQISPSVEQRSNSSYDKLFGANGSLNRGNMLDADEIDASFVEQM